MHLVETEAFEANQTYEWPLLKILKHFLGCNRFGWLLRLNQSTHSRIRLFVDITIELGSIEERQTHEKALVFYGELLEVLND